ncbi:hypothetical protein GW17_00028823 [Ensete ventricosum]|nr:hypothetical protein GW17_00028823 [Ensete ventricosum]
MEGLLMTPHLVGTPLELVVVGGEGAGGDSKEIKEKASGALEVLETSPTSGAGPATEGSIGQAEVQSMLEK